MPRSGVRISPEHAAAVLHAVPRWEASEGFRFAAKALLAQGASDWTAPEAGPVISLAMEAFEDLTESRPLVVAPEQVLALPALGTPEEELRYLADASLPFDDMYFDFMRLGRGVPHRLESEGRAFGRGELLGCLATALGDAVTEYWPIVRWTTEGGAPHDGEYEFPGVAGIVGVQAGGAVPPYFRDADPAPPHHAEEEGWDGRVGPWFGLGALLDGAPYMPGWVSVETWAALEGPRRKAVLEGRAIRALECARLIARVLFFLDSANVEIQPAAVSRQVRRAAERDGARISDIVVVRQARHPARPGDGAKIDYSHRFEVRGHFAHYGPETRLYQHSAPGYLKPCPRCGTCRRIWVPPYVKGPETKPLVPKVRILAREEEDAAGTL